MKRLGMLGAVLSLGAALAALALAGQPWFSGTVADEVALTGRALTGGLATAIPTAAGVGVALVLVFGRAGRRVIGVLLVLLAAGLAVAAWGARSTTVMGASGLMGGHTAAWTGYLACAVGVALGGAMLVWQPGARRARPVGALRQDAWSVLDRGADPTLDGR